jgi:hypothetical protein
MAKPILFIHQAVSTINSIIIAAQHTGKLPAFSYDQALPNVDNVARTETRFPSYSMEFGKNFGSRVTLSFRAEMKEFNRPAEYAIGTSGNQRTIEETIEMAKTMAALTEIAQEIRSLLAQFTLAPTPEAIAYVEEQGRAMRALEVARAAEYAKFNEAKKKATMLKGRATRHFRRAHHLMTVSQAQEIALLMDAGKSVEAIEAIAAIVTARSSKRA